MNWVDMGVIAILVIALAVGTWLAIKPRLFAELLARWMAEWRMPIPRRVVHVVTRTVGILFAIIAIVGIVLVATGQT